MQSTQHMMDSTHVWASTQTEQLTAQAMLPSLYRCKVGGLLHIELYAAAFIALSDQIPNIVIYEFKGIIVFHGA